MARVSVLVPTFNRAEYLAEAIESVRLQSYGDWELVVVDDGSTDATKEVVGQSAAPIHYVYQTNQGVSVARNRALSESKGEYVVFLDSDDLLLPGALAALSAALDREPSTDIVYSDGYIIDESGARVCELARYRREPVHDSLDYFVEGPPVNCPASAMLRREALAMLDGPFDEKMLGYEDWDLFVRLKAAGCRFSYVPELTCCYRFHGGNKSAPRSSLAERRRQSLIHSRLKVLNAKWFDSLSLTTRYRFFLDLLTGPMKGELLGQGEVLAHPAFSRVPPRERAALLYHLASENALGEATWNQDLSRLAAAIRLRPQDPRPYFIVGLSLLGSRIRRRAIQTYRRIRSRPVEVDPVTRILRSKNVA